MYADLPVQDDLWALFARARSQQQIAVPLEASECSAKNVSQLLAWIEACNLGPYLRARRSRCCCVWCCAPDPDDPWLMPRFLNMDFDGDELNCFRYPTDDALHAVQRALSAVLRSAIFKPLSCEANRAAGRVHVASMD